MIRNTTDFQNPTQFNYRQSTGPGNSTFLNDYTKFNYRQYT